MTRTRKKVCLPCASAVRCLGHHSYLIFRLILAAANRDLPGGSADFKSYSPYTHTRTTSKPGRGKHVHDAATLNGIPK
jgi:hypothetical protein